MAGTATIDEPTHHTRENVVAQPIGDEIVLLDLTSGFYYSLNEVGAFLWRQLDGRLSASQLVDRVLAEYEVSEESARADVQAFLAGLLELDLLGVR